MRQNLRAAAAAMGMLGLAAAPAAQAEEGMWTFDNFPADRMREEMGGARPGVARSRHGRHGAAAGLLGLDRERQAGLVLTNHHCVIACVSRTRDHREQLHRKRLHARARAKRSGAART